MAVKLLTRLVSKLSSKSACRFLRLPLICATSCLVFSSATYAQLPTSTIEFRHVYYLYQQGESEAAYQLAQYYEKRLETPLALGITRAGLALDLGWQARALSIMESNVNLEHKLAHQQRLRFYLAHYAYRVKDWDRFRQELSQVSSTNSIMSSPLGIYLAAESHRLGGEYPRAFDVLAGLEPDDVLYRYGSLNLALSIDQSGDHQTAIEQLSALSSFSSPSKEHLVLADRSKMALATLELEHQGYADARAVLDSVSAEGIYAPFALNTLARLEMTDKNYEQGAAIWNHLIDTERWHPAAQDAHVGLPLAIERAYGGPNAYPHYQQAMQRLTDRYTLLQDSLQQIESIDTEKLAVELSNMNVGALDVVTDIVTDVTLDSELDVEAMQASTNPVADYWQYWLADDKARLLAKDWLKLRDMSVGLKSSHGDIGPLLSVDVEQRSRTLRINQQLLNSGLQQRVAVLASSIKRRSEKFSSMLSDDLVLSQLDALSVLATAEDAQAIARLAEFKTRAEAAQISEEMLARIERLQGLYFYRLLADAPRLVQSKQSQLHQQQARLEDLRQRTARINLAETHLDSGDGIHSRLMRLNDRSKLLSVRIDKQLDRQGQTLIAHVTNNIRMDMANVDANLNFVQFALARISDQQLQMSGADL